MLEPGPRSIAMLAIEPKTGMLTLVADAPTGGKSRGILRWIPPASTYWRRISFPATSWNSASIRLPAS